MLELTAELLPWVTVVFWRNRRAQESGGEGGDDGSLMMKSLIMMRSLMRRW